VGGKDPQGETMKAAILLAFVFVTSCAAYKSYNQTTTGKVTLRGGNYQEEIWDEKLIFTRMSWYHGMTLYYDALIYKADLNSPFTKWFSPSEKEFFSKCESLIVAVNYSASPDRISHVNFREQMKLNGYDDVVVNTFATYLRTHPNAQDWRIFNYKIMGYCKRSPTTLDKEGLIINFPSFKELAIKI
jgi:hypothetical protein